MDQANADHTFWMQLALQLAKGAGRLGNVPVGAVLVKEGVLLAKSGNLRHTTQDPTAHAECIALRKAAQRLGAWRLDDTTLYVTLEPCSMCAGAIEQARVTEVIYGASDPTGGAFSGASEASLPASLRVVSGVLEEECQMVLTAFFTNLRSVT